jgi:hypothetical protein
MRAFNAVRSEDNSIHASAIFAQVTKINLGGYSLAFVGVCWYNYKKLQGMKARTTAAAAQQKADLERHAGEMTNGEKAPLMGRSA